VSVQRNVPREAPVTAAEIASLSLAELRMFAYTAWAAAARRRVTLADLAAIPAATGRPLGVRVAAQVLRDLQDTGILAVSRALDTAGSDTPLPVFVAGRLAPATPPQPVSTPLIVPRMPAQKDGTPIPMIGRIGTLLIPVALPAPLRESLLGLVKAFRAAQGAPPDTARTADLLTRKADALEQWAALPLPYGTARVRQEAERTRAAADNAWSMHRNRQQRLATQYQAA
jgi:hypothetical protein